MGHFNKCQDCGFIQAATLELDECFACTSQNLEGIGEYATINEAYISHGDHANNN